MIALSRFFLFSSTYLVLLILSSIASAETEYFSMITFLITSLSVGGWLYYLHKIAIEPSPGLKEILYVVLFLNLLSAPTRVSTKQIHKIALTTAHNAYIKSS